MTKYLYDLFLTCRKNNCPDLVTMALPMMLCDARTGIREYTAEETDIEALHADYDELMHRERELREFLGRHIHVLGEVFSLRDRAAFDKVVAQCIAEDKAKEKAAEG